MKFLFALLVCVSAALADDVLVLTADNFDAALNDNAALFVKFYAPWCGHCKTLAPIWDELATDLKESGVAVGKVDVTVEEALGQKYGIQGFPTLKFFKNGALSAEYRGPRSADDLKEFALKKSGKPYTVVASFAEAETILASESSGVVVGYFSDFDDDDFDDFEAVADASSTIKYLVVSDATTAASCDLGEEGSIIVLSKDGAKHAFSGEIADELADFALAHAFPQSMDLDPELFQTFLSGNVVVVTAYDFQADGADAFRTMATEAATKHSLKQMFADSNQWGSALVRMGVVSGNVYPTAVAFDGRSDRAAPVAWDEDVAVTAEGFGAWLTGVVAGTQETWKKSEAVPENNDGPVKVLVSKQFDEIALDSSKDVLVEFYAPWCGHCKNLAPIYEAVGEHFQNDKNVVIAKMDATANFVDPTLGVQGFPTLKFFPSESKDVVDYEGDRTLEDIIEFISSNRNSQA